jgi:hypothetical protein
MASLGTTPAAGWLDAAPWLDLGLNEWALGKTRTIARQLPGTESPDVECGPGLIAAAGRSRGRGPT